MELPPSLQNSPHLLGQVLGALTHAVILADLGGGVLYLNPQAERLLGCPANEAQGQALSRFFMPDDQDFLYPNLLHLAGQGQAFRGELLLRNGQGQGFFAFLSLEQVPPAPGQEPLILMGLEDIDRQKKLEKILGKANYGDLLTIANSIAHELRNPLTGIGGFVNRLYKSCRISMDHDQYYRFIIANLNRIELLVRKVNDLVALHDPTLAEESIGVVVEDALRARGEEIAGRQITVRTQIDDVRLALDKQQIQRGLSILIDNALEFTPQGGAIHIEARQEDNCCRLTFSDSGRGIAAQDLPFIFNPFFSTKADGLGIDLAVLKRIVQAHGGNVQAQSQPGQGATFLLEIPLERRRAIRTALLAPSAANR